MIKYKSADDQGSDRGVSIMAKSFIGIEIGKSAYTEFKMKDGKFAHTEDGIFLGSVEAQGKKEALEKLMALECNKERIFDKVVLYEVVLDNNYKKYTHINKIK